MEQNGLVVRAKSQDLKNILGLTTIIDCQHGEQRQESKKTLMATARGSAKSKKNRNCKELKSVAGSHTMFLYCHLVQNEILGDIRTALLRSIPLESLSWTDQRERKEVNHRSFSNLQ